MLKPNDPIEPTPGPWRIGVDQKFEPGTVCIFGAREQPGYQGAVVCRIAPKSSVMMEDHANAILLRAALELREASKELLAVLPKTVALVARVGPAVAKVQEIIDKTDPEDYDNMLVATCPGDGSDDWNTVQAWNAEGSTSTGICGRLAGNMETRCTLPPDYPGFHQGPTGELWDAH